MFPISRDPPEGGTGVSIMHYFTCLNVFPISRDPPEGGTVASYSVDQGLEAVSNF